MSKIDWNDKEAVKKYNHECYLKHKEEYISRAKKWKEENIDKVKENNNKSQKKYYRKKIGRAIALYHNYKRHDKEANREEGDLTPEWIIENIFSKPCAYCGETDWHNIGCDRIDNSLPHTIDNVVPCCCECNKKRGRMDYNEFKKKWE